MRNHWTELKTCLWNVIGIIAPNFPINLKSIVTDTYNDGGSLLIKFKDNKSTTFYIHYNYNSNSGIHYDEINLGDNYVQMEDVIGSDKKLIESIGYEIFLIDQEFYNNIYPPLYKKLYTSLRDKLKLWNQNVV